MVTLLPILPSELSIVIIWFFPLLPIAFHPKVLFFPRGFWMGVWPFRNFLKLYNSSRDFKEDSMNRKVGIRVLDLHGLNWFHRIDDKLGDWGQALVKGNFDPLKELYNLGNILEYDIRHSNMVRLQFLEELKYLEIIKHMVIIWKWEIWKPR
jgi:hypothetical protein